MRISVNLIVFVVGLLLVVGGTFGAAEASGPCGGTAIVTGGGSGGGIICSGDCPDEETCDIHSSVLVEEPLSVAKWCDCTNVQPPMALCCQIVWIHVEGIGHAAEAGGSCQVANQAPCPLPGSCMRVATGSQYTAVCD